MEKRSLSFFVERFVPNPAITHRFSRILIQASAILALLAAILLTAVTFHAVASGSSAFLWRDEWLLARDVDELLSNGSLETLIRPHWGHRMIVPRLVLLANAAVTGWQPLPLLLLTCSMLIGVWLLMQSQFESPRTRPALIAGSALAWCALISPYQIENLIWPFQFSFIAVYCFSMLAFWFMSRQRVGLAAVMALLATASMANGLAAWPILALQSAGSRMGKRVPLLFACATGIAAWLYLSHGFTPHTDGVGLEGLQNPGAVLKLALMFFGGPFSNYQVQIGMAIGLSILTAVATLAIDAWLNRRFGFVEAALSFVIASSLVIILGRFSIDWIESRSLNGHELLPGRYYTPAFLVCALLATHFSKLLERPPGGATTTLRLFLSLLGLSLSGAMLVSVPAQHRYAGAWMDHFRALDSTFSGIVTGASDQLYMASLLEDAGLRDSVAAIIRRRGWSGAGDFRSSLLAERADTFATEKNADCIVHVDQFVQAGDQVRLAGWAWNSTTHRPPRDLLFVCPDGLICGFGRTGLRRPDLGTAIGSSADERPGFIGYAKGRHAYGDLGVLFLSGERTYCEARVR